MPWLRPDDLEIAAGIAGSNPAACLCSAGRRAAGLYGAESVPVIGWFGARKLPPVIAPESARLPPAVPAPRRKVQTRTDPPPVSGRSFRTAPPNPAVRALRAAVGRNIPSPLRTGPVEMPPGPRPPGILDRFGQQPIKRDTPPARGSIAVCAPAVEPRFLAAPHRP